MKSYTKYIAAGIILFASFVATPVVAANGLFDINARKIQLAKPAYAAARQACMAVGMKNAEGAAPEPIAGFSSTEAYGSDKRAHPFVWKVMILSGRVMTNDATSATELIALLDTWASARALEKTEVSHDAYYALKRTMLPTIVAYNIVQDKMEVEQKKRVKAWLNRLVRRTDKKFNGVVDRNNHRYLADSVLMVWGNIISDNALYNKGKSRFMTALKDARADGTLPLETRRGARANWYMRHAATSLTVMAEAARMRGDNLYAANVNGNTLDTINAAMMNGINAPASILSYASENYIPGPSDDYIAQDDGILNNRGNGRHYLAYLEAYVKYSRDEFTRARAIALLNRHAANERPLIDEYLGGNGTCFYWEPRS